MPNETRDDLSALSSKSWSRMTAEQKRDLRLRKWRHPEVGFVSHAAEEDYHTRVDRLIAAISLYKPDRVPVRLNMGAWPARAAGMTPYDMMTDPQAARQAWIAFHSTYQPDAISSPTNYAIPASMLEALDYRLYSWPGHGVARDSGYQYLEKEWMLADEYDHLISDPTDYLVRVYLPRSVGAFSGFRSLSSFFDFVELPFISGHIPGWDLPDMLSGLQRIAVAAKTMADWRDDVFSLNTELNSLGFPSFVGSATKAPFDILGDTLRGTKGVLTDMLRRPDKVLAACDRLVQVAIDWAVKRPEIPQSPLVSIPLHKGADAFMSDEQFRTFYWPTLRRLLLGLIDEGMIPFLFAEGRYNSRLQTIMDLPERSTVWLFDQTDMTQARATVGQVSCIQGNMPLSLLHAGSVQEVRQYTRALISAVGQNGGFILDVGAVADEGKSENLAAMIETARDFGTYEGTLRNQG